MYLINFIHSNQLLKTLPQPFYIAQSQKKLWRPALRPRRFESRRRPHLSLPPPLMLTLYYLRKNYKGASAEGSRRSTGGKRRRKNYKGASVDGRRRKNYPAAE